MAVKLKQYTFTTKLHFGKYIGKSVQDVLNFDPKYVKWAYENIDWFKLDDQVMAVLELMLNNSKVKLVVSEA